MQNKELIRKLRNQNPKAQKELYDCYAPKFLGLCVRYLNDIQWAENAMMEAFLKIFTQIDKYRDIGNFQSWMYKIVVNQCLMQIRKNHNFNLHLNVETHQPVTNYTALENLYEEDLLKIINQLPVGCKTVFNLYFIEGYSHKEIAYKLKITEGTSKSQLHLAKNKIKKMLESNKIKNGHTR